jgi:hypothetical protein
MICKYVESRTGTPHIPFRRIALDIFARLIVLKEPQTLEKSWPRNRERTAKEESR